MVKLKESKNVNWGKASYLATGVETKVEAMKIAKRKEKEGWMGVVIIPEISYGMKRPFAYTIIAERGFK